MPQDDDIEVEQEADREIAKPKVSEKLSCMERCEAIDRLDLDNQRVLDDDIEAIATSNPLAAIIDRQLDLTLYSHPSQQQFPAEARFVCRFEQARSKRSVHLDCGPDDEMCQSIVIDLCVLIASAVIHPANLHRQS